MKRFFESFFVSFSAPSNDGVFLKNITYMEIIVIKDLKYKPYIEFFNVDILDKVFTGIKRYPSVYVIKTDNDLSKLKDIQFDWQGIRYSLQDIYEHYNHSDWKIVECAKWQESKIE